MRPVLDILDRLYATRMMLERLGRQYGDAPKQWPPPVAQQLRGRHNVLSRAIQKHVCSLSDDCYPIGDSLHLPLSCNMHICSLNDDCTPIGDLLHPPLSCNRTSSELLGFILVVCGAWV